MPKETEPKIEKIELARPKEDPNQLQLRFDQHAPGESAELLRVGIKKSRGVAAATRDEEANLSGAAPRRSSRLPGVRPVDQPR